MKTHRHISLAALAALTLSAAGCRLEPGPTDYASQSFVDMGEDADQASANTFLPGPDPFVEGESRISFGPFYEGSSSEQLPVDDVNNFFFIFQAEGQLSFDVVESADRVEGFTSDTFVHNGTAFWGMSIAFYDGDPNAGGNPRPEDFSKWSTMHISLRSSDAAFSQLNIGQSSASGEGLIRATDYGYENDGEWHSLEIPMADLQAAGADLSAITSPLVMTGGSGELGESLQVDNFYLSGE